MAKKKRNPARRNFFRVVGLIGLLLVGGIGYGFIGAAPRLSQTEFHIGKQVPQCLHCHTQNVENAPIMPHRPMTTCTFCHSPQEAH